MDHRRPRAFRRLFLAAVERLGGHLESRGELEAAAVLYARGTAADPLAETLYRRQMATLHRLGRQAEAVEVYRRCRQLLSVLIGGTPSAETEALRRQIG